jgi:hypothetical protein
MDVPADGAGSVLVFTFPVAVVENSDAPGRYMTLGFRMNIPNVTGKTVTANLDNTVAGESKAFTQSATDGWKQIYLSAYILPGSTHVRVLLVANSAPATIYLSSLMLYVGMDSELMIP